MLLVAVVLLVCLTKLAAGKVFTNREEALKRAFPFLSPALLDAAAAELSPPAKPV